MTSRMRRKTPAVSMMTMMITKIMLIAYGNGDDGEDEAKEDRIVGDDHVDYYYDADGL